MTQEPVLVLLILDFSFDLYIINSHHHATPKFSLFYYYFFIFITSLFLLFYYLFNLDVYLSFCIYICVWVCSLTWGDIFCIKQQQLQ